MRAWKERRPLLELLAADPDVTERLRPAELKACFDPALVRAQRRGDLPAGGASREGPRARPAQARHHGRAGRGGPARAGRPRLRATLRGLRVGKLIEVDVDAATPAQARARVDEMCRRLLANPMLEDYTIDVEGGRAPCPARSRSGKMATLPPRTRTASREERLDSMRFGVVVFPGTWSDCDFHYVVSEVVAAAGQVRVAPGARTSTTSTASSCPAASRTATTCARAPWPAARRWWRRCREFLAARRARARLVQRLPDPLRGRAAARARSCATSACSTAVSRRTWSSRTSRRRSRAALRPGQVLTMPISHGEGKYHADAETLRARCAQQQPDRVPVRDGRADRSRGPRIPTARSRTSRASSTRRGRCSG